MITIKTLSIEETVRNILPGHLEIFYPCNTVAIICHNASTFNTINVTENLRPEKFEDMVCITLTPTRFVVTGTLPNDMLRELSEVINDFMRPYQIRRYEQELAYKALDAHIIDHSAGNISSLASSLAEKPKLTEYDGYNDTLGERAFFALVEQGACDINEAYQNEYVVNNRNVW